MSLVLGVLFLLLLVLCVLLLGSFGLGVVVVFEILRWQPPFWVMLLWFLLCGAVFPLPSSLGWWSLLPPLPFGAVLLSRSRLVSVVVLPYLPCPLASVLLGVAALSALLLLGAACFLPLPCWWCCFALLHDARNFAVRPVCVLYLWKRSK